MKPLLTFVIPVRIDSPERTENLRAALRFLGGLGCRVLVLEADAAPALEGKDWLRPAEYTFVSDAAPVFHRTRYINWLLRMADTDIVAVWDTDVLLAYGQILEAAERVCDGCTIAYPYNGQFVMLKEQLSGYVRQSLDLEYLRSCFSTHFYSYCLDEVVRQGEGSLVLENATALRRKIAAEDASLPFLSMDFPHDLADMELLPGEDLEETLQKEYGRRAREDVVFITRSNKRANLFNNELRGRVFGMENELAAGELLMIVKNNYFWLPSDSNAGFLANGDMIEVLKIKRKEEIYGFHFADIEARLVDYPAEPSLELKLWLESLQVDAASLPYEQIRRLFSAVMEDYQHLPSKARRLQAVREDPYFNALQVKYSYALTCHKTQGGQWPCVFVDAGCLKEDMLDAGYLRWLYTALTRTLDRAYLLNFPKPLR